MSTDTPAAPATPETTAGTPAAPHHLAANPRRVIATYMDYAAAQKAVDYLSDEKFDVSHVAIVGRDLQFVEQITGRLNWGRAALGGLASGVSTGLFIGLLLGLFVIGTDAFLTVILWSVAVGAVIGAVFALIAYAMSGGKRDFTSVGAMRADTYDVMVDADHAADAERILAGLTGSPA